MGLTVFKLPDIGEGIAESEIALWRIAVGDLVAEDQPLVDMLTDKAAVEIPSPFAGKIVRLHGEAGDKIAVGGELVTLELIADAPVHLAIPGIAKSAAPERQQLRAECSLKKSNDRPGSPATPAASPAVRKRARELGIDLEGVKGTGPVGRILHTDLDAYASAASVPESTSVDERISPSEPKRTDPAAGLTAKDDDAIEQIRVIGLRRKIAEAMQRSKQRIPHFAYVEEVDVTELEALRSQLNQRKPDGPKLTLLPFLIQAIARAVQLSPMVNATFDDEAGVVTRYKALHVGIATQTPNGLLVPVLKNAQTLDLWQRAFNIKRLADAARAGKASREDLTGSTITITSLGALGGIATTPVINAPEVAIIGVNKMIEKPVVRHSQITTRAVMNLSSSFDHRIVDGFDAATFIQSVRSYLEHPALLFLDVA